MLRVAQEEGTEIPPVFQVPGIRTTITILQILHTTFFSLFFNISCYGKFEINVE